MSDLVIDEYAQRLKSETRNVASLRNKNVGHELFHRALEGGQRASGQRQGGLAEGSAADLLTLNADDPMLAFANADDLQRVLIDLPPMVLYDLSIRPAIAIAAGGDELTDNQLDTVAHACWRAITRD